MIGYFFKIHLIKFVSFCALIAIMLTNLMIYGQGKFPIDTIYRERDTMVLFSDKSWEFIRMINFDGVTNPVLSQICQERGWLEDWNTDHTHTYGADLSQLSDTLWLCTVDDSNMDFCIPHPGMVTSTFKFRGKRFHYGIDVDCETGDTLKAAFNGIVRYAKFNENGYGNLVIIRHYNGLETYYAHLSKLLVVANQEVKAGDVIGLGGNTGKSYGDHLHFEIRLLGNAINPEEIIDFNNNVLRNENLLIHRDLFLYGKSPSNYSSTSTTTNSSTKTSSSSGTVYHTVKSGDTLYGMALKYKTTVKKICELNGIKETKVLKIGEKIKVK
jgi:hypothetical protein